MADFYRNLGGRVGSDDESQISDVDPSQLAKMVEVSFTFLHQTDCLYHQTVIGKGTENTVKSI